MQKGPQRPQKNKTSTQTLEAAQWHATLALYWGLLALYALGKAWPT